MDESHLDDASHSSREDGSTSSTGDNGATPPSSMELVPISDKADREAGRHFYAGSDTTESISVEREGGEERGTGRTGGVDLDMYDFFVDEEELYQGVHELRQQQHPHQRGDASKLRQEVLQRFMTTRNAALVHGLPLDELREYESGSGPLDLRGRHGPGPIGMFDNNREVPLPYCLHYALYGPAAMNGRYRVAREIRLDDAAPPYGLRWLDIQPHTADRKGNVAVPYGLFRAPEGHAPYGGTFGEADQAVTDDGVRSHWPRPAPNMPNDFFLAQDVRGERAARVQRESTPEAISARLQAEDEHVRHRAALAETLWWRLQKSADDDDNVDNVDNDDSGFYDYVEAITSMHHDGELALDLAALHMDAAQIATSRAQLPVSPDRVVVDGSTLDYAEQWNNLTADQNEPMLADVGVEALQDMDYLNAAPLACIFYEGVDEDEEEEEDEVEEEDEDEGGEKEEDEENKEKEEVEFIIAPLNALSMTDKEGVNKTPDEDEDDEDETESGQDTPRPLRMGLAEHAALIGKSRVWSNMTVALDILHSHLENERLEAAVTGLTKFFRSFLCDFRALGLLDRHDHGLVRVHLSQKAAFWRRLLDIVTQAVDLQESRLAMRVPSGDSSAANTVNSVLDLPPPLQNRETSLTGRLFTRADLPPETWWTPTNEDDRVATTTSKASSKKKGCFSDFSEFSDDSDFDGDVDDPCENMDIGSDDDDDDDGDDDDGDDDDDDDDENNVDDEWVVFFRTLISDGLLVGGCLPAHFEFATGRSQHDMADFLLQARKKKRSTAEATNTTNATTNATTSTAETGTITARTSNAATITATTTTATATTTTPSSIVDADCGCCLYESYDTAQYAPDDLDTERTGPNLASLDTMLMLYVVLRRVGAAVFGAQNNRPEANKLLDCQAFTKTMESEFE